ncbi:Hsp20/alpha crystallin family protein [Duganella sp. BJB1802]|uniref:Hsp20/alpha crystallin family protein n=1 Tax=Duganella sp. BJB1802 TaxID=2744575 RepID=UPI001593A4A9|nr:Hsp20/alpha crystallin family protein [Duganella sp. BJB1802]NVD71280.1 Hsp20/alpha crystallin family protein [Duganella sp. BJB1802]
MANSLMRIDPFRDLARFDPFRDMDEMFRDFAPSVWRGADVSPRMRMDVSETDKEYLVKAEIPGVQKEDIKVAVNGNQVSLSAEVKEEQPAEAGKTGSLRSERYYGQVQRSFTLPQEVDDDQAEARYENGVLHLSLPKRVGTGGKQLAIQ